MELREHVQHTRKGRLIRDGTREHSVAVGVFDLEIPIPIDPGSIEAPSNANPIGRWPAHRRVVSGLAHTDRKLPRTVRRHMDHKGPSDGPTGDGGVCNRSAHGPSDSPV